MSPTTSDSGRPSVLAWTEITRSRFEVIDARRPERRPDLRDLSERHGRRPPCGPWTSSGRLARSAARARDSGASRTVTSRVLPVGSTQSPASTPANAGRSACATSPTRRPSDPASARSTRTSSSGFWPRVDRPTSTAPGTWRTSVSACVGQRAERRRCPARAPAPESASGCRARSSGSTPSRRRAPRSCCRSVARDRFLVLAARRPSGSRPTYTLPSSTAPDAPPTSRRCARRQGWSARAPRLPRSCCFVYARFEPGGVSTAIDELGVVGDREELAAEQTHGRHRQRADERCRAPAAPSRMRCRKRPADDASCSDRPGG